MSQTFESFSSFFKAFSKEIGLEPYLVDKETPVHYSHVSRDYSFGFMFIVPGIDIYRANSPSEEFAKHLCIYRDKILESPLVSSELKAKASIIDKLQQENIELRKYKLHYDIQMKLNHGESYAPPSNI
jgi:hypothetical protein